MFKKIIEQHTSQKKSKWKAKFRSNTRGRSPQGNFPEEVFAFFEELAGLKVLEDGDEIFSVGTFNQFKKSESFILEENEEYWTEVFAMGFGSEMPFKEKAHLYCKNMAYYENFENEKDLLQNPFKTLISINGQSEEILFCEDYLNKDYSYWIFSGKEFLKLSCSLETIVDIFFSKQNTYLEKIFKKYIVKKVFRVEKLEDFWEKHEEKYL